VLVLVAIVMSNHGSRIAVQSGFYLRPIGILPPSNREPTSVQSGFYLRPIGNAVHRPVT
jgi:hypothetical protein